MDSGIGTTFCAGKSVISSGFLSALYAGGFMIWGDGVKGSLKCASPSYSTVDIRLYLAAFLRI